MQYSLGSHPGFMNPFVGQGCKLRDPTAHVRALRIKLLTLQDGIEDPEIRRGIGTAAS